jgi:hypothetical protein
MRSTSSRLKMMMTATPIVEITLSLSGPPETFRFLKFLGSHQEEEVEQALLQINKLSLPSMG